MSLPVIILGAGGHAKVLLDILIMRAVNVIGFTEPNSLCRVEGMSSIPIIGNDEVVKSYSPNEIRLVNGLGSVNITNKRKEIFERFKSMGYTFETVIHPSAIIASGAKIAEGVQVMAGAIIQTGSYIGYNTIVNTKTSVDHDCVIEAHVHLAPGVTLSGGVQICEGVHIGSGATVTQGIRLGCNSLVGAGAVVIRDVPEGVTVFGVPAQIRQLSEQ